MCAFNVQLQMLLFFIKFIMICDKFNYISAKAIVGQNVRAASDNEFPYVVAIVRDPGKGAQLLKHHICTGTLISQQDVLTAEHCVLKYYPQKIKMVIGSVDLLNGRNYYPLWWMSYNQWASHNALTIEYEANDILMIKLTENVHPDVQFTNIAMALDKHLYRSTLQIVGWGKTNNGQIPQYMQTADVRLLKNDQCRQRIYALSGDNSPINKRRLCTAAEPYALVDSGDSGGPLLHEHTVIGINQGVCPHMNNTLHPRQINFHLASFYYKNFILDIKDKYEIHY